MNGVPSFRNTRPDATVVINMNGRTRLELAESARPALVEPQALTSAAAPMPASLDQVG
jgi:hypothetical protein